MNHPVIEPREKTISACRRNRVANCLGWLPEFQVRGGPIAAYV